MNSRRPQKRWSRGSSAGRRCGTERTGGNRPATRPETASRAGVRRPVAVRRSAVGLWTSGSGRTSTCSFAGVARSQSPSGRRRAPLSSSLVFGRVSGTGRRTPATSPPRRRRCGPTRTPWRATTSCSVRNRPAGRSTARYLFVRPVRRSGMFREPLFCHLGTRLALDAVKETAESVSRATGERVTGRTTVSHDDGLVDGSPAHRRKRGRRGWTDRSIPAGGRHPATVARPCLPLWRECGRRRVLSPVTRTLSRRRAAAGRAVATPARRCSARDRSRR